MPSVADLYTKLQSSCDSINGSIAAIAAQIPSASPDEREQLRESMDDLSDKEIDLRASFIKEALSNDEITSAIEDIRSQTTEIDIEAAKIDSVVAAMNSVAKILGYVAKIAATLAPLLA